MTLRLFDTASRSAREFVPLRPGKVGIYVCGATVQAAPHIGHLRPAIVFDILRRWLVRSGYEVTFVRNVTDIDDKILDKSAEAGRQWWAHAYHFEREFSAAYDALGILPPTYEPRATGHVSDMIALIERLIERGHAYVGDVGNVYFDVRSFPDYGGLTNQRLEDLTTTQGGDSEPDKRFAHDFALWKAPKPGEPASASWPTPWGVGRPGWHLECSAMSWRYLGEEFDIHGGGIDLRFPHHENERAQSRAAGFGFVRHWVHNGWITQAGVKMSKSLGNTLGAAVLLAQAPPVVLRYALSAGHYRSQIEFSDDSLVEAGAAWERVSGFVTRAGQRLNRPGSGSGLGSLDPGQADDGAGAQLPAAFAAALDDDLNVSDALAVVHETVRRGNTALSEYDDVEAGVALDQVRDMLAVLGLDPLAAPWAESGRSDDRAMGALDVLISGELARRAAARSARDFATADAIRDQLTQAGIMVEDSAAGAHWSLG